MPHEKESRDLQHAELRVKDDGDNPTRIGGYAAIFNLETEIFGFREKIAPGAFRRSLAEKADVRALINHDDNQIIGRTKNNTLKLSEDDRGLATEIIPPKTSVATDLIENIRNKNLDGMSFGFFVLGEEWSKKDGVNIRTLTDVELIDVSVVTFPAYPQTTVAVRKRLDELNAKEAQATVQELEAHNQTEATLEQRGAELGLEDRATQLVLEQRAQEVQSVKANKKNWTRAEFAKWLRDHDFKDKLEADDPDSNFHAAGQFLATQCEPGSFAVLTENMPRGIQLRTCERK